MELLEEYAMGYDENSFTPVLGDDVLMECLRASPQDLKCFCMRRIERVVITSDFDKMYGRSDVFDISEGMSLEYPVVSLPGMRGYDNSDFPFRKNLSCLDCTT